MILITYIEIILFGLCCLYLNSGVHSYGFNSFIEHCTEEDSEYRECDLVKFLKPFTNYTMRLSGIAIAYDGGGSFQSIYFGTGNCINRAQGTYLRLLPNAVWHIYPEVTVVVVISPTIGPMSFFLDEEAEIDIEYPHTHIFILNGELKTYGAKRRCVVPVPDMGGVSMYHFNGLKAEDTDNPAKFHKDKLYIGKKHNLRCLREQREDNFTEINMVKKIENLVPEYFTQCRLGCEQTEIIVARNLTRHYMDPDAGKIGDLIIYHLNDTHNNNTFKPNVNEMETILYDYEHEPGTAGFTAKFGQPAPVQNSIHDGTKVGFDSNGEKINRKRSPVRANSKFTGNLFRHSDDLRGGKEPLSDQLDPVMNSRYEMWRGKKEMNTIIPYEAASLEEFEKERNRIFKRLTLSSMMRLKNAASPRKGNRELMCLNYNKS